MINKCKNLLVPLVAASVLWFGLGAPVAAFNLFSPCSGQAASSGPCSSANQGSNGKDPIVTTINDAANIIAVVAGIAAVIMIIAGALTMVGSAGNAEGIAAARRRVIFSLVGLVVIALAWTITRFITDNVIK